MAVYNDSSQLPNDQEEVKLDANLAYTFQDDNISTNEAKRAQNLFSIDIPTECLFWASPDDYKPLQDCDDQGIRLVDDTDEKLEVIKPLGDLKQDQTKISLAMPAKHSLESLWSDFPLTTESFFLACPENKVTDGISGNDTGAVREQADEPDDQLLSPLNLEQKKSVPTDTNWCDGKLSKAASIQGPPQSPIQSFGKSLSVIQEVIPRALSFNLQDSAEAIDQSVTVTVY